MTEERDEHLKNILYQKKNPRRSPIVGKVFYSRETSLSSLQLNIFNSRDKPIKFFIVKETSLSFSIVNKSS